MSQPNPTKCESSSFSFSVLLLLINTVMLASLTILHNPLVKVADNLTDKYQKEQRALMCSEVLAYEETLKDFTRGIFKAGCITTVREKLLSETKDPKKQEEIKKWVKERDSLEFEKIDNYCSGWASAYELNEEEKKPIGKMILSNMFYEMKCDSFGKTVQESITEIYRIAYEINSKEKSK